MKNQTCYDPEMHSESRESNHADRSQDESRAIASTGVRYSESDKLGIALALIGVAVAIVLFLIEKTPRTILLLLVLISGVLVYPVVHFFRRFIIRVAVFVIVFIGIGLVGLAVWPPKESGSNADQKKAISEQVQPQSSPANAAIDSRLQEKAAKPQKQHAHVTASGKNSVAVGSVTQGPCSILQAGGSRNQATTNCVPPSRIPSEAQISAFKATLQNAKDKFLIRIFPAGSTDDVEPTIQALTKALSDIDWPFGTAGYVGYGGGPAFSAEGIECYSLHWETQAGNTFIKAMDAVGLPCKQITGVPNLVGDDGFTVLVGRPHR